MTLLFSIWVQTGVLFGLGLAGDVLLGRRAPSPRRRLLMGVLVCSGALLLLRCLDWPSSSNSRVLTGFQIFVERVESWGPTPVLSATASRAGTGGAAPYWVWAVWLWGGGTLGLLLRTLVGLVEVRRLGGETLAPVAVASSFPALSGTVFISPRVQAPVVVGLFRPRVLLPAAYLDWAPSTQRIVLVHEGSHVRQRDGLVLLIAEVARAAFWPQPLAWVLRLRLRASCEEAADDAVTSSGVSPTAYASQLLALAAQPHSATVVGLGGRRSLLRRRIERLCRPQGGPPRRWLALSVYLCVVGGVCALALTEVLFRERPALAALVLDAPLQALVESRGRQTLARLRAERAVIVVLDPKTGRVRAKYDNHPAAPILPASVLKPLGVATALNNGDVSVSDRFDCGEGARVYGAKHLQDADSNRGLLSLRDVLVRSSNVGMSHIFDRMAAGTWNEGMERFGVQSLPVAQPRTLPGALLSVGHGIQVTPETLVRAYGALANQGRLALPFGRWQQVVQPLAARQVLGLLREVVESPDGTGRSAAIPNAAVAGKTGTSEGRAGFATFVGIVPAEAPRWVILVSIGGAEEPGWAGTLAAPVFAEVAGEALRLP